MVPPGFADNQVSSSMNDTAWNMNMTNNNYTNNICNPTLPIPPYAQFNNNTNEINPSFPPLSLPNSADNSINYQNEVIDVEDNDEKMLNEEEL